ncbi:hypothetical protein Bca52824_018797 [Brassica carinata]|uniref:DALR anticodon binding domain-containing protein n=1 Tax=Brassica carinata TaxID=52824 RepID=A0A8X7VRP3_BRACI|nr:hypothetical protein Bca52824_018797 [Brassica carinata]
MHGLVSQRAVQVPLTLYLNSSKFYLNCQVIGTAEETSRLPLCEAKAIVMRKCFHLFGITPVYKM